MVKSLVQKVAPYVFVGLGLIGVGCGRTETITVSSSKVSYKLDKIFILWNITERKSDGTKIKYDISPGLWSGYSLGHITLEKIKINGEEYSTEDTAVFNRAEKKMNFLVDRYYFIKDSTRQANGLKALK